MRACRKVLDQPEPPKTLIHLAKLYTYAHRHNSYAHALGLMSQPHAHLGTKRIASLKALAARGTFRLCFVAWPGRVRQRGPEYQPPQCSEAIDVGLFL